MCLTRNVMYSSNASIEMPMNQSSHAKTLTIQSNEFFLLVQMILIDILSTPLKRNVVMNSYIAL